MIHVDVLKPILNSYCCTVLTSFMKTCYIYRFGPHFENHLILGVETEFKIGLGTCNILEVVYIKHFTKFNKHAIEISIVACENVTIPCLSFQNGLNYIEVS